MVMQARKQEKMSQSELAAKVGTNKTYISRIERGLIEPGIGLFCRIADALGLRVELIRQIWVFNLAPLLFCFATQLLVLIVFRQPDAFLWNIFHAKVRYGNQPCQGSLCLDGTKNFRQPSTFCIKWFQHCNTRCNETCNRIAVEIAVINWTFKDRSRRGSSYFHLNLETNVSADVTCV